MTPVRFERPWSLYNPGETAGFDPETARILIESGVAVAETAATPAPAKRRQRGTEAG
jgi:hypothetical protein